MLKFKINKRNINKTTNNIIVNNINTIDSGFTITTPSIELLKGGDNLIINRSDGLLTYKDILSINNVNYIDKTFAINNFPVINYGINTIFNVGDNKLYISLSNEHYFIRNNQFNIKKKVSSTNVDLDGLNIGDYIIVDDYFLYQLEGDLSAPTLKAMYNTTNDFNVDYKSVRYALNGTIPMTIDGFDDKFSVIIDLGGLPIEVVEYIEGNFNTVLLYSNDTRFIDKNILTTGTTLILDSSFFNIQIGSSQRTISNLFQTENVDKYFVEKAINDNINAYVDMEKYVFKPYILDNNNLRPLNSIELNFHFRDREGSDRWQTNDNKYWNGFAMNDTGEITPKLFSDGTQVKIYGDTQSDLLGYLNFSDNDVRYQKNKLKKSFVRLLYYDSPDINQQQLLYYSTIFLNTNQLFGKYSENNLNNIDSYQNIFDGKVNSDISVNNEYVSEGGVNEDKRLSTRITLTDKYNNSNSSEGFYLYLFPETFKKPYEQDVYLKVEFNHAGYGTTIPFILPISEESGPIPFITGEGDNKKINPQFPTSFLEVGDNGAMAVNMQKYFNSLYVKLKLRCDYQNNTFAYYVDNVTSNGENSSKLILNFVEPKVQ